MSINELRAEITATKEWRRSVWLRRLFLLFLVLAFVVAALMPKIDQPPVIALVPLLIGAALQPAWHLAARTAPGVYQDTKWIALLKIAYITDPVLRRYHRRDVFWLPRR